MSSFKNDILFGNSSYSKDDDASDISSQILFSFGMGLCISILCCTVFMFCSRRVDSFITSRLTRNHVFVVHYMDERCSSHISELETWTDTDYDAREDADTFVPFNIENNDDRWVEAMMSDLVRIHSPSEIERSSIHQIADLSNRMQYVECAQLELAKSNGGFKVICDNSIPPQMRLSNRSPIPIDSESNHLK